MLTSCRLTIFMFDQARISRVCLKGIAMAEISYVDDDVYTRRLGSPQTANLLRVVFHSPEWANALVRLVGAQMGALQLPAREREMVILQTGFRLNARYVIAQHEGISQALGVTEAQREAIEEGRTDPPEFSERDKALLSFVDALVRREYGADEPLRIAKRYFSERELVEIVGVQGLAGLIAGMMEVFRVEVDPVSADDLLEFSRSITN